MSRSGRVGAWVRDHQRAAGIGLLSSAVILLGIAVAIGYTMFTELSARTGQPGSSGSPSAIATATSSASASVAPGVTPASMAPSFVGAPSVSPSAFTGFEYADILRVEVNRLAVRVAPSRSSPLVQAYRVVGVPAPEPLGDVRLNAGDSVTVELGPLPIGDTTWYLVWPAENPSGSYGGGAWSTAPDNVGTSNPGWVAASVGQDEYLAFSRRPEPSEYESFPPDGPRILSISGNGNYDSGPQVRFDLYSFKWAVAIGDQPAPCAFAVRLLPEDGSEPVIGIERFTAGVDQGPMSGPGGILAPPWGPSAGGAWDTFTVSIRSGCTWTVGLVPLAHD